MQFKPLPDPPADDPLARLDAVRTALPATPDPDLDCCASVIVETAVETRDEAADWLTFCRALEIVAEEPDGYRRETVECDLDPAILGNAFRSRVVGAGVTIDVVDATDEPLEPTAVFGRLDDADAIPRSARRRHGDQLEAHWIDRIRRMLDWAVAFELVERVEDGYRA